MSFQNIDRFGRAPLLIAGALVLLLTLAACGSDPTATPLPTATPTPTLEPGAPPPEPTATPTPRAAWEIEWDELVIAAQAEGELILEGSGHDALSIKNVYDHFEELFGIKMINRSVSGRELADRLLAERAAGRFTVDFASSGMTTTTNRYIPNNVLTPLEQFLFLPDVTDTSLWHNGHFWWGDADGLYAFNFRTRAAPQDMGARYNTNLVSQEEIDAVNSLWDLVGPQWDGRVVSVDPYGARGNTPGQIAFMLDFVEPGKGQEWLEAFFSMDIAFAPNDPTAVDWIAQGAYDLCLNCGVSSAFDQMAKLGLPIGNIEDKIASPEWEDPRILHPGGSGANYVTAVDKVPHPNARKLWINWFLSQEGQQQMHLLADAEELVMPTLRVDVAEFGNADPLHRRDPNLDYVALEEIPDFSYEASQARAIAAYDKYHGDKAPRR